MHVTISLANLAYLHALYDYSVELKAELTLLGGAKIRNDTIYIEKLMVPEQEGSAMRTEVLGPLGGCLDELEGYAIVWVHTHPKMGRFWSATDDGTKDLLAAPPKVELETAFAVSIVMGREGPKCHVAVYAPIPYEVDDVPLVVVPSPEQTKGAGHRVRQDFKGKFTRDEWWKKWKGYGRRGPESQYGQPTGKRGDRWWEEERGLP